MTTRSFFRKSRTSRQAIFMYIWKFMYRCMLYCFLKHSNYVFLIWFLNNSRFKLYTFLELFCLPCTFHSSLRISTVVEAALPFSQTHMIGILCSCILFTTIFSTIWVLSYLVICKGFEHSWDHVSWDFLLYLLGRFSFGEK